MSLPAALLPPLLTLALAGVQLAVLLWALIGAPWRQLHAVPSRLHLLLGCTVLLMLLWLSAAELQHGLQMHVLGMAMVVLTVGSRFAVLCGSLAQLLLVVLGQSDAFALGVNCVLNVSIPAAVAACTLLAAARLGMQNPFGFMLGVGFLGGALSMLAMCLSAVLLIVMSGQSAIIRQWDPALLPLVMFPEGFLNGALLTAVVVYAPHWLRAYDEP